MSSNMEKTFFKMIGQKIGNKILLVASVDEDFMNCGETPTIFEVQCAKPAPNIYTGTFPNITVNTETMKPRMDLKGLGVAGIITKESWYCVKRKQEDVLGIAIK